MCMTESSLINHQSRDCAGQLELRKAARVKQDLNGLIGELDKEQVTTRDEAIRSTAYVEVTLTPSQAREIGIGFTMNADNLVVVEEVMEGGLAFFGIGHCRACIASS